MRRRRWRIQIGALAFDGAARWLRVVVKCPGEAGYADLGRLPPLQLGAEPLALSLSAGMHSGKLVSEGMMKTHKPVTIIVLFVLIALSLSGWAFAGVGLGSLGPFRYQKPERFGSVGRQLVEGACTSFCIVDGERAVFGTNYDNQIWEGFLFVNPRGVRKSGWESGTNGKVARWTARYGSVTFNLAGVQMAWAGMNEAGLVISTMWLGETHNPPPDERPPLVSPLWVQYQLDTCATLEEVIANDARVRIVDTVDHYLVCDRSGACAAVEFLDGKTVFHAGVAMPVKTLTNYAYQKAVAAWQVGRLAGNSLERFGIAADRTADFGPGVGGSAVAYAFETLEGASGQATGGSPTQWSIVFDMQDLQVHFRTSRNPQTRSLDFANLDFECGSPPQMLDVHAPLSGEISAALGRFSFAENLKYTQNFLNKWGGADLSPFEVEVLLRGLDSFPCERPVVPYQAEEQLAVSPLISWVALALLHRLWPLVVVAGASLAALVVWRVWSRRG